LLRPPRLEDELANIARNYPDRAEDENRQQEQRRQRQQKARRNVLSQELSAFARYRRLCLVPASLWAVL
jgi:DNA-binding TFAR19-related protein (PDSD5 family)